MLSLNSSHFWYAVVGCVELAWLPVVCDIDLTQLGKKEQTDRPIEED